MSNGDYPELSEMAIDKTFWTEDSVSSRKKIWDQDVKKRVVCLLNTRFPDFYFKEDIKDLERYFLYGEIAPYETMNLFFILWLHPFSDIDVWRDVKIISDGLNEKVARQFFYHISYRILHKAIEANQHFPDKYLKDGFLGDRTWPLYKMIVLDKSSKWDVDEKISEWRNRYFSLVGGSHIREIFLRNLEKTNNNSIGFYIADKWLLEMCGLCEGEKEYRSFRDDNEKYKNNMISEMRYVFVLSIIYSVKFNFLSLDHSEVKKEAGYPIYFMLTVDPLKYFSERKIALAKNIVGRLESDKEIHPLIRNVWEESKEIFRNSVSSMSDYIK